METEARRAVERKIEALARGPGNLDVTLDVKKLAGPGELWRLRVGTYRVVFRRDPVRHSMLVVAIAHRKDVYI